MFALRSVACCGHIFLHGATSAPPWLHPRPATCMKQKRHFAGQKTKAGDSFRAVLGRQLQLINAPLCVAYSLSHLALHMSDIGKGQRGSRQGRRVDGQHSSRSLAQQYCPCARCCTYVNHCSGKHEESLCPSTSATSAHANFPCPSTYVNYCTCKVSLLQITREPKRLLNSDKQDTCDGL